MARLSCCLSVLNAVTHHQVTSSGMANAHHKASAHGLDFQLGRGLRLALLAYAAIATRCSPGLPHDVLTNLISWTMKYLGFVHAHDELVKPLFAREQSGHVL